DGAHDPELPGRGHLELGAAEVRHTSDLTLDPEPDLTVLRLGPEVRLDHHARGTVVHKTPAGHGYRRYRGGDPQAALSRVGIGGVDRDRAILLSLELPASGQLP